MKAACLQKLKENKPLANSKWKWINQILPYVYVMYEHMYFPWKQK